MISSIDLKPQYILTVKNILKNCLPAEAKVWIFGSRVLGTAKPFSDIDLLIDLGYPLSLQQLAMLNQAFDDSDLPYKVDLADAQSIGELFKKNIADQLRSLPSSC